MRLRDRSGGDGKGRGHQAAHVQRVDGNIRLVAGVNRGSQFGEPLGGQRKARRKENQHFSPRNRAKIFRQAANRKQHGASAEIRFGTADRRHAGRSDHDGRREGGALAVGFNVRILHSADGSGKQLGVGGEILPHYQAAAEINHGHQAVGPDSLLDKFCGGRGSRDLGGDRHGGGVGKKNHVMLLGGQGAGGVIAEGKG